MPVVLVVEDDPPQRAVATFTLRKVGYDVREAVDGAAGLDLARRIVPDLVICDVMMPRMNGYQLVAAIRADPELAATPVILLTAMSERAQMRMGMTSGADDYLCKPYRPHELLEAIDAVMERRHAQSNALLNTLRAKKAEPEPAPEPTGPSQIGFRNATLLLVDLFGPLHDDRRTAGTEQAARVLEASRDTLYLFGASQVLPYADDLLAVFGSERDAWSVPATARAARAAFALNPALLRALRTDERSQAAATVSLHIGDVDLIRLQDVLHSDAGYAAVPATPLRFTAALRQFAKRKEWPVSASAQVVRGVPADVAAVSAKAVLQEQPVVELKRTV